MKLKIFTLFVTLLLVSNTINSQAKYTLTKESTMKVDGSSTVSEWSAEVKEATGSFTSVNEFKMEVGAMLYSNLEFSFPVDKMESGRGPIMNSKIKKALLSTANPLVIFKSSKNKITSVKENKFVLECEGTIAAAGVEKPFTVLLNGSLSADMKTISFEGNKDVTMSMFNIVKPTAFFGKLKTKDELNVKFNVSFIKQ
ncbi:YceI-like domain-containing protein [Lutibacter oricola]|uniref:YceI-like domain-containing protein n=1 Tax=Lutibacter oricola TaxID=762486 RepID=A0A1H2RGE4_9FLAO|nr:YceI family protein [Lutibacter oricola]SDW18471.1 YceI-like domain-containing protein [Lutibacter oricola]